MRDTAILKPDNRPLPWHWILTLVTLVLIGLNSMTGYLTGPSATAMFAVAILLAGIPHGTLDIEIIAQNLGRTDVSAKIKYTAVYLICAAAMGILWFAAAPFALVAFLGISIIHFGRDWRLEEEPFLGFMVGGALIALPALSHNMQVAEIFEILVGPIGGNIIADGLACISLPPLLASLVFCAVALKHKRFAIATNIAVCLMAAITLPPLAAFAVFFCGLHSPRHFRDALHEAGGLSARNKTAVIFAVTTLSLGLGVGVFVMGSETSFDAGIVRTVFVLLSILTLPHFLLEQLLPRFSSEKNINFYQQ